MSNINVLNLNVAWLPYEHRKWLVSLSTETPVGVILGSDLEINYYLFKIKPELF